MHLGLKYGGTFQSDGQTNAPVAPPLYRLVGYADNNYAGDPEDRKSVMRNYFYVNGAIVSWCSKKQQTVLTSTTEAEYIALDHAFQESIWIQRFLDELEIGEPIGAYTLHGDNETSIILTKNADS